MLRIEEIFLIRNRNKQNSAMAFIDFITKSIQNIEYIFLFKICIASKELVTFRNSFDETVKLDNSFLHVNLLQRSCLFYENLYLF